MGLTWLPALSTKQWKIVGIVVVLIVVLLLGWCGVNKFSNWREERAQTKLKNEAANAMTNVAVIKTQIANLETQKALQANVIVNDTNQLANLTYGREEAKQATNAALANYQKALTTNANTDATADDLKKALEKLDEEK